MSVQPISGGVGTQSLSSVSTDSKNLKTAMKALKGAQSSGDQDRVTISQDAIKKARASLKKEGSSSAQGAHTTRVHKHHHQHHSGNAANLSPTGNDNSSGGSSMSSLSNNFTTQAQNNLGAINVTA